MAVVSPSPSPLRTSQESSVSDEGSNNSYHKNGAPKELGLHQMHVAHSLVPACHGGNGNLLYNVHGFLQFSPEQKHGAAFTVRKKLADQQLQEKWSVSMWVHSYLKKDRKDIFALLSLPCTIDGHPEYLELFYQPLMRYFFVRITNHWYPRGQRTHVPLESKRGPVHVTLAFSTTWTHAATKQGLCIHVDGEPMDVFPYPHQQKSLPIICGTKGRVGRLGAMTPPGYNLASSKNTSSSSSLSSDVNKLPLRSNILHEPPWDNNTCNGGHQGASLAKLETFPQSHRPQRAHNWVGSIHTVLWYKDYLNFGDAKRIRCEHPPSLSYSDQSSATQQSFLFGWMVDDPRAHELSSSLAPTDPEYVSPLHLDVKGANLRRNTIQKDQLTHILSLAGSTEVEQRPQYRPHDNYSHAETMQALHDTHHQPYSTPEPRKPPEQDKRNSHRQKAFWKTMKSTVLLGVLWIVFAVGSLILYYKSRKMVREELDYPLSTHLNEKQKFRENTEKK